MVWMFFLRRDETLNKVTSGSFTETLSPVFGVSNMLRREQALLLVSLNVGSNNFTPSSSPTSFIRELPQGKGLDIAAPLFREFGLETQLKKKSTGDEVNGATLVLDL